MSPVRYKRYLELDSTDHIPRSTLHYRRRRKTCVQNDPEYNELLDNSVEQQDEEILNHPDKGISDERLPISSENEYVLLDEPMRTIINNRNTGHDDVSNNNELENNELGDNLGDQRNLQVLNCRNENESEERLPISSENKYILIDEQMGMINNNRDTELNDVLDDNVLLETSARNKRWNADGNINEQNNDVEDNDESLDVNYDSHDGIFPDEIDPTDVTDDLFNENMDDENEDNNNYDRFLNTKLCSCTETTKGEALMMALLISQKHSLTWVATLDILHMTNKLYNCDKLPSSKYGLFKHFPLSEETIKFHVFCPNCERYLVERDQLQARNIIRCPSYYQDINEDNISSFFTMLNVKSQIKNLLENIHIRNQLRHFSQRRVDDDIFSDIVDGNAYKTLLADKINLLWDLSYTFNTDGCQPSKSSQTTIWPIYMMLNELPPEVRSKHMILVGLWVHTKEPNMNTFLRPFVNEANSLVHDGVEWNLNNDVIVSKIYPACCLVDSVARPSILNMKRFNGHFGCNFCEHPTERVDRYRRFTISTRVHPDRTDASIRLRMEIATHANVDPDMNMGIEGPSVLMNLDGFDLAKEMVPDYMHSVLLGVTRQYTESILSSPLKPYYVGSPNDLAVINSRLTLIQPPSCITRSPRSLEERHYWKASEWRSWLIWYMIVCLRDVLPLKYLKHLGLLVGAIHLLIQELVSLQMITLSYEMLLKFVTLFQDYFGKSSMTFNVYLLLHLSQSVFNWGPLWANSTFPFETANRFILQMKTSPHRIATQIAKRYSFYKNLPINLEKFERSNRFVEFCEILFNNRLKHFLQVENCTLIGSGKDHKFTNDEMNCYSRLMECKVYEKTICYRLRFTSETYKRTIRCNDSVIVTQNGTGGIIQNICCCEVEENDEIKTEIVLFYRKIVKLTRPYLVIDDVSLHHIRECAIDGPLQMCHPELIIGQGILMFVNNTYFISDILKGCLND